MYAKIIIQTELEVMTGMHIGGSSVYSAIGAVNSPVIHDAKTYQPIIPGSSIKGKLRTLLVRSIRKDIENLPEANEDDSCVLRLFGSGAKKDKKTIKGRLQFADAFVLNAEDFKEIGLTEIKFENTIDRRNGGATPRQIERVNRGVKFGIKIAYDLTKEEEFEEDMKNLAKAMKLLQLDYLGGNGTRGSGRVNFKKFNIVPFEDSESIFHNYKEKIEDIVKEVEDYELFSFKTTV